MFIKEVDLVLRIICTLTDVSGFLKLECFKKKKEIKILLSPILNTPIYP